MNLPPPPFKEKDKSQYPHSPAMLGTFDLILNILLLLVGISTVIGGLYGLVYRYVVSKKHGIRYLDVEMSIKYQVLFWILIIPLFILQTIKLFFR